MTPGIIFKSDIHHTLAPNLTLAIKIKPRSLQTMLLDKTYFFLKELWENCDAKIQ